MMPFILFYLRLLCNKLCVDDSCVQCGMFSTMCTKNVALPSQTAVDLALLLLLPCASTKNELTAVGNPTTAGRDF